MHVPDELEANLRKMTGGKKVCMLHGNCQTSVVLKYMIHNVKFDSEYVVLKFPDFFAMKDDMKEVYTCDTLLKNVELFISQMVSEENKFGRDIQQIT